MIRIDDRIEECLTCKMLDKCRYKDNANDDANGHCITYVPDIQWVRRLIELKEADIIGRR